MSVQPEAFFSTRAMGSLGSRSTDRGTTVQRARLAAGAFDTAIDIELADTTDRREDACSLINRRYAWRGYGSHHTLPAHRASATFTASDAARVLGTVTLVVDSDAGLAADKIFADELNPFRETPGRKICELSRLAFETGLPSKPLLAALFHIVFIYGYHHHRCTDLFIEVNPRHRRFYEAMLGFKPIGAPRTNASVGAPSQLMWLEISSIRRRIDAAMGDLSSDATPRSLYALFFSRDDALELADELTSEGSVHRARNGNALVKVFLPDL
ncbi:hypothetical protein ABIC17_000666 [Sphingomonas sp. PvP056]